MFDTVIFVRSLLNPRSMWGQLIFQHFGQYRLFVSRPVVVEILEVLQRPELTSRFRRLPGRDPNTIIALLSDAEVVELAAIPAVSRGPNGDKFLATAVAAEAEYIISEDQDLRVLQEYQGVKIIGCEEFLHILETQAQGESP